MRFSRKHFEYYIGQSYFDKIGRFGVALNDEYITFLTFDKWKVFYEADPDNWGFYHDEYYYVNEDIYFPFYTYIEHGGNSYRVIKFPTLREYRKFFKYYKMKIADKIDCSENQKEILELAQIIGEKSKARVEEEQKKLQETYQKTLELASGKKESDPIQKYFNKESAKEKIGSGLKLPYRIKLGKRVDTYFLSHGEYIDRFIKVETGSYPVQTYSLPQGNYIVYQEKFSGGYTYCRISQTLNIWVRICDIDGKEKI